MRRLYGKAGKIQGLQGTDKFSLYFRIWFVPIAFSRIRQGICIKRGIINGTGRYLFSHQGEVDRITSEIRACNLWNIPRSCCAEKKRMEESKDYILPSVIYGDKAPILEHGNVKNLKGVGTSPGTYPWQDKDRKGCRQILTTVCDGDILIIPFLRYKLDADPGKSRSDCLGVRRHVVALFDNCQGAWHPGSRFCRQCLFPDCMQGCHC